MILHRVWRAIRTPLRLQDWRELAAATIAFAFLAGAVASITGLTHWSPRAPADIAILGVRAVFIPALGEELIFRAAMVPGPAERLGPASPILFSTAAFVLWHIVETTFLPGSAATFLRSDFLILAAMLGLACAILRWRSGSIWTAVTLHWAIVFAWRSFLGGPSFGA